MSWMPITAIPGGGRLLGALHARVDAQLGYASGTSAPEEASHNSIVSLSFLGLILLALSSPGRQEPYQWIPAGMHLQP